MASNENKCFLMQYFVDDGVQTDILEYGSQLIVSSYTLLVDKKEKHEKERNKYFYEVTVPNYRNDQFLEHFRMNRWTFEALLNVLHRQLGDTLQPYTSVPLAKKVLFTIWLISKQESFLAVGDRFNIPKSSGHGIFKFIIFNIAKLIPQYVKWPNAAKQAICSQIFEEKSHGIAGVVGVIDGCHIPIKQPIGNSQDYFNRKQFHSIILQGVCDAFGRFIDVYIGMPGRMHDARVFQNSPLHQKLTNVQSPLLRQNQHLLGDSAYPLLSNLMTPFRDNGHLQVSQTLYNIRLSSIRSTIERAFGLLKGKFRRLKYMDISDMDLGNHIIAAACVLHNFILTNGDIDDVQPIDTELVEDLFLNNENVEDRNTTLTPQQKRNQIMNNL